MTLFEKIDQACRLGKYPIVQYTDDNYRIVIPDKDHNGFWRESSLRDCIDACLKFLHGLDGESKEVWNKRESEGVKYIGTWERPQPEPFKVGAKVRISERIRNVDGFNDWKDKCKAMVGEICEIRAVLSTEYGIRYKVWTEDKSDCFYFGHDYLEPVFDDEVSKTQRDELLAKADELITKANELKQQAEKL